MAKIISASIDLAKIDKNKIVTTNKDGQPFENGAKYLNIQVVLNDEIDQYGNDTAIRINQSKEERDRKDKPVYIGNGKTVWNSEVNEVKVHSAEVVTPAQTIDDDLPF
jgi:hypothetical protein